MNLKSKKLITVFVVPVVIIAAVAGHYLYPVEEPIRVDEGYGELTIGPVNNFDPVSGWAGRCLRHKNVTGVTTVNSVSQLSLRVEPLARWLDGRPFPSEQTFRSNFQVRGAFEGDLNLESLIIEVTETQSNETSSVQFWIQDIEIDGGERWPEKEFSAGQSFPNPDDSAFIGFDLYSNEFVASGSMMWLSRSIEENFTLQFQAIVKGNFSERVVSTVVLYIEGCD